MRNDLLLKDFFNEVQNFKECTQAGNETADVSYPTEFMQLGAFFLYEKYKTDPDLFSFTADSIIYASEETSFTLSKERFLSVTGKEKEHLSALFVNPEIFAAPEPTEETQMTEKEKQQALEIERLREALENANKKQEVTANVSKPEVAAEPTNDFSKYEPVINRNTMPNTDDFASPKQNDQIYAEKEHTSPANYQKPASQAATVAPDTQNHSNNDFAKAANDDFVEAAISSDVPNADDFAEAPAPAASDDFAPDADNFAEVEDVLTDVIIPDIDSTSPEPLQNTATDDFEDVTSDFEVAPSDTDAQTPVIDENPFKKAKNSFLFNEHEVTFVRKENGFEQNGKLYVFPLGERKQEELGSRIFAILDMNGLLRHGMSKDGTTSIILSYNHSDYVIRGSFKDSRFSTNVGTISRNIKEIRQQITNHNGNGKTAYPVISIEGKEYYVFPHGMANNKSTGLATITMFCKDTNKVYLCDDLQNITIEGKEKLINVQGYWTKDYFCIDLK